MSPYSSTPLLSLEGLSVSFATEAGLLPAVRDVTFRLNVGETTCLVGESGCGKSLTAKAILRLLPENAVSQGRVLFQNTDLLALPERDMQNIRGRHIGMVFQEPMTSLNPVLRIGYQVAEPLRRHLHMSAADARTAVISLLADVGIPAPKERYDAYPHQLSGGMRQRVMLAMAMACHPTLLLADEPTTALDVTIQGQILRLLQTHCRERGMAVLLITHDLHMAAQMAGSVGVMYAGRLVEFAPADALFAHARHPYTQGLLHAAPTAQSWRQDHLTTIPGNVPPLDRMPPGCPFHPRCAVALPRCAQAMPPLREEDGHSVACWQAAY